MKTAFLILACAAVACAANSGKSVYAGMADEILPQIAAGDGWRTTITIVNLDTSEAQYKATFFDENGAAMTLSLVGRPAASTITGKIPVNGSVVLQTNNGGSLRQGWARIESTNYKSIGGMAVFGYTDAAGAAREAVVPLSSFSDDDAYLPFDNTAGFATALAICNSSLYADVTVTAAFFDESGNRLALDQFTLPRGRRLAIMSADKWPQTAGKRGTVHLSTPDFYLSILGLRASPGGGLTSTHTLSKL